MRRTFRVQLPSHVGEGFVHDNTSGHKSRTDEFANVAPSKLLAAELVKREIFSKMFEQRQNSLDVPRVSSSARTFHTSAVRLANRSGFERRVLCFDCEKASVARVKLNSPHS